ncbi:hypothetical protein BH11ACT3_BH11ACT3_18490 [soil metagenome]
MTETPRNGPSTKRARPAGVKENIIMNILIAIVAIVAVILLFTGGFVQSLNFLLWVGLVLLAIAVIVWLVRMISGRRAV